ASARAPPPPPPAPRAEATRTAPARAAAPAAPPSASAGTACAPSGCRSPGSPVGVSHHGVERADDRDQVGDERVVDAGRRRLERGERRRAEVNPPRPGTAVGDDVAARLAARRLDRDVDLAL